MMIKDNWFSRGNGRENPILVNEKQIDSVMAVLSLGKYYLQIFVDILFFSGRIKICATNLIPSFRNAESIC